MNFIKQYFFNRKAKKFLAYCKELAQEPSVGENPLSKLHKEIFPESYNDNDLFGEYVPFKIGTGEDEKLP